MDFLLLEKPLFCFVCRVAVELATLWGGKTAADGGAFSGQDDVGKLRVVGADGAGVQAAVNGQGDSGEGSVHSADQAIVSVSDLDAAALDLAVYGVDQGSGSGAGDLQVHILKVAVYGGQPTTCSCKYIHL